MGEPPRGVYEAAEPKFMALQGLGRGRRRSKVGGGSCGSANVSDSKEDGFGLGREKFNSVNGRPGLTNTLLVK